MRSKHILGGALAVVLASCARIPDAQEADAAVLMLREYHHWAWAFGIVLLWFDLVLPVPQTAVIAALGIIYGSVLGGLLGTIGLISGGLLGYGLMRTSARRFASRWAGGRTMRRMESAFETRGAWAIVLTRSLPYSVPEAMVFLAGLAGMPVGRFAVAVAVRGVRTGCAFAAAGAGASDPPGRAFAASYLPDVLLVPIVLCLLGGRAS